MKGLLENFKNSSAAISLLAYYFFAIYFVAVVRGEQFECLPGFFDRLAIADGTEAFCRCALQWETPRCLGCEINVVGGLRRISKLLDY